MKSWKEDNMLLSEGLFDKAKKYAKVSKPLLKFISLLDNYDAIMLKHILNRDINLDRNQAEKVFERAIKDGLVNAVMKKKMTKSEYYDFIEKEIRPLVTKALDEVYS